MENLDLYLVQESLLEESHRDYLIIDSDCDPEFHQKNNKQLPPTQTPLKQVNLNSQFPSRTLLNHLPTPSELQLGSISQFLKGKKQGGQMSELLKQEINKVESECEALELLIDKAVKKEAELIVRKTKIVREGERNFRQTRKNPIGGRNFQTSCAQAESDAQEELDIKKTIKAGQKNKKGRV